MTLNEFIERIKLENGLDFSTIDAISKVTEFARSKATNGSACLTDSEVKKVVIEFANGHTEIKSIDNTNVGVKNEGDQLSLFDL